MATPIRLSASQVGVWQSCQRAYWFKYGLGRRTPPSSAQSFGSIWHEFMEMYWRDGVSAADLASMAFDRRQEIGIESACKMAVLLSYYYVRDRDLYEVEAVEQEIEIPITNRDANSMHRATLLVKVDGLLIEKATGRRYILEHKTTSQKIDGFSQWWQAKTIDRQLGYYYLAVEDCAGIIYDVVRKPQHKLDTKANADLSLEDKAREYLERLHKAVSGDLDGYYQVRTLGRTEQDLEAVRDDIYAVAQQIRHAVKGSLFPRNSDSCQNPYTCDYIDVCSGGADIFDEAHFESRDVAEWAQGWAV